VSEKAKVKLFNGYVNKSSNIFDLYIQIFTLLEKYQSTAITEAEEKIVQFNKYSSQFDEILEDNEFKIILNESNKESILAIFRDNEMDIYVLLIALLASIDEVFGNQKYSSSKEEYDLPEKLEEIRSLNSKKTYNLGKVFYKYHSFIENLYSDHDFIRQSDNIENNIKRYQQKLLIYHDPKTDYKICLSKIKWPYVNDMLAKVNKSVNIALVPLTGEYDYLDFVVKGNKVSLHKLNDEEKYKHKIIENS